MDVLYPDWLAYNDDVEMWEGEGDPFIMDV